jgi:anti-sigma factor RsiW
VNCKLIRNQLIGYLDDKIDNDRRKEIEAHLKDCSHCSEFLIRLEKVYNLINEEKQVQHDPYMFTRIMARLEDRKPVILRNRFRMAFQTVAYIAIIVTGIYSGILIGKNFTNYSPVSADYQNEIYYLDELQHENMISVLLTD